jgi:hypothetical protein
MRAPSPMAKQRALALLARAPGREGMWDTEDAIRVVEGAQKVDSEEPLTHPPTAPVQNDVRNWIDIAARLKSKKAWPFGERLLIEVPFTGGMGVPGQMQMGPPVVEEVPDFTPQFAWLLRKKREDELDLDCCP